MSEMDGGKASNQLRGQSLSLFRRAPHPRRGSSLKSWSNKIPAHLSRGGGGVLYPVPEGCCEMYVKHISVGSRSRNTESAGGSDGPTSKIIKVASVICQRFL